MKKKIMAAVLAVLCSVSLLSTGAVAGTPSVHEQDLEKYILKEMPSANILGLGISVVSAEKELYCAAYGTVSDTDSDFVLGSLSKSFTAAAILHLAEDGELSLEDTVSDYLSDYEAVSDVTILELLNQTSGIRRTETMSAVRATGTRGAFEDANANYNLLGEIVEAASGISYEEYLSDNILDANEMTSTYSMRTEAEMSEELINGYRTYFGFPVAEKYTYSSTDNWTQVPSGYLISDIKDMGRYLQMYLKNQGDVLSEESIKRMLAGDTKMSSKDKLSSMLFDGTAAYGMGWAQKEVNGQRLLYAGGSTETFSSMMVLLPEQDMGIVMLFNSSDPLVGQKLLQTLEEGIVSIEMGQAAKGVSGNTYLLQHAIIDVLLLLLVILAWIPIFAMGTWSRHRKKELLFVPGMAADAVVHVVLPTALLLILPNAVPVFLVKRFTPDIYHAVLAVIASLYLGAIVKLFTGIVIALKGKKAEEETTEENSAEDSAVKEASEEENAPAADTEEKAEKEKNTETDEPEAEPEKEEKTDDKKEEKAENKEEEKEEEAEDNRE